MARADQCLMVQGLLLGSLPGRCWGHGHRLEGLASRFHLRIEAILDRAANLVQVPYDCAPSDNGGSS